MLRVYNQTARFVNQVRGHKFPQPTFFFARTEHGKLGNQKRKKDADSLHT